MSLPHKLRKFGVALSAAGRTPASAVCWLVFWLGLAAVLLVQAAPSQESAATAEVPLQTVAATAGNYRMRNIEDLKVGDKVLSDELNGIAPSKLAKGE